MKPLTTEPPLDPPETIEDRKDAVDYKVYKSLKNIQAILEQPNENELELQHMALQAEEDELDRDMYSEDAAWFLTQYDDGD
tara:strand:- start:567 stop:809 length:243 start_codon:yes stop_codon:yes gene_type:complete